jgi:site-specific recombinase XerD
MSTAIALIPVDNALPALPVAEIEAVAGYARAEKSEATRVAYRSDFRIFSVWCSERGQCALPATVSAVAAYLAFEAAGGARPSTIGRRVAAIRYAHRLAGMAPPTDDEGVKAVVRGIRREHGAAPNRKSPATADKIVAMAPIAGERLGELRDRALLLIGFAGAFRRSELTALNVEDIEESTEGLRVTIRRSKTDQEAQGATIGIPRGSVACPVAALRTWLAAADISGGPVFRPVAKGQRVAATRLSDKSVATIVKQHAERVGLDPEMFAGHSLRSGFLTSAAAKGASLFRMMDQSRHKSVDTLRGYVRAAELFKDHAGAGLL